MTDSYGKNCSQCGKKLFKGKCSRCDSKGQSQRDVDPSRHECKWHDNGNTCPMTSFGDGKYCIHHASCQNREWGGLIINWLKKNWKAICKARKHPAELDEPRPPKSLPQLRQEVLYEQPLEAGKTKLEKMYDNNPELLERIRECDTAAEKMAVCAMALDEPGLTNSPIMKMIKRKIDNIENKAI